jgi:hypothetical protein
MTALFQRLPSDRRFLMALVAIAMGAGALPLAGQQTRSPDAPDAELIKPGDWLRIQVIGTLPSAPIQGPYRVEASGKVALGPEYGRVQVNGQTLEGAEEVLLEHLARSLAAPKLQITRYELPPRPGRSAVRVLRVDELEKEAQPKKTEKANARTKELQQKRLAVLEEIHDSAKQLFASARTSFDEVHAAAAALLAARIEYAESQKDRIKVCDEAVQEAVEWQKFAQQMAQAGQATGIVELKAQAYLLEAQIAREKAETED